MKRMRYVAMAGLMCASGALAACGSDDGADGGDGGGGGEGKVGVILPDTESSVRWETADKPALEAAFDEAGVEHDIQNANGDTERMATIADQMINEGVTVLAIVNLDSESGAAIQRRRRSAAWRPSTTTG
jgi:D-xylose transport system substrate-binding protein